MIDNKIEDLIARQQELLQDNCQIRRVLHAAQQVCLSLSEKNKVLEQELADYRSMLDQKISDMDIRPRSSFYTAKELKEMGYTE